MIIQLFTFFLLLAVSVVNGANTGNLLTVPLVTKLLSADQVLEAIGLVPKSVHTPNTNAVVKVVATVQCGDNQEFKDVLIDTGSAVLWVGGENPYVPGPHSVNLNTTFGVGYGAGGVSGNGFRDTVTIGEAKAKGAFIGAATSTNGFTLVKPIDGILGLGPSGSNDGDFLGLNATPTFVENSSPKWGYFKTCIRYIHRSSWCKWRGGRYR